ncbi:peptide ABC transporter ATP-binding protein [Pseudoclavibacter sp. RFBJ3]|uniref:ATP-binding cassette domain-containing protein n=1 Tax=unclassified Pseudoclavibacter TaxID=2615177 RepID=UPI000CE7673E|nr:MULTISPECIES: ATP-binding cassette domain-containing protein [unclassified Pseudoclavibacter]PPF80596.1 peptide ABC transporter ATP-binding protein [Pseudoclavibacter sp. RFBJ5]PPF90249.1 peptide ABC transporter ATP-binding protein [Pseudoclavibacter sp. RFBJ3]PPF94928.1 peptide ABC transporter ATP-binding protein [Pseudoclavibacter sp. RFBH5]PPG19055.1 peptide ABC transporter ATP-binding protein [Pseudoclavibacter sp. RFBI4]
MTLLDVRDLKVAFPGRGWRAKPVEILHGVSLQVGRGECLGLVGESGSGKTTIGRAVLGLVQPSGGEIDFDGKRIDHLPVRARRALSKDIQVVFQDPYTSLNPSMTIGDILAEPLVVEGATAKDARSRVRVLLDQVGLPSNAIERLPREFSGGQRQRVAIARALAPEPKLIVCDEPVSALDLSTQERVLDLFIEIQRATGVAYLFVSHDLSVVRHISHRVAVLYRGDLVETGPAAKVTKDPDHAYTKKLLLAAPVADPIAQRARREERHRLAEAAAA